MSGVLEPEEIDALMGGLSSGEVEAGTDQPEGTPVPYDFTKQNYAIRRLIPAISMIQSLFAEGLKTRISSLVPALEDAVVDNISIMKRDELLNSLAAPASITVFHAPPLATPLYLAFESDLVYDLVDRYFGGRGRIVKARTIDRFSATEFRFMETLTESLLSDISAAWQPVLSISPQIQGWQNDPRYLDDIADTDTLIVTRLALTIGEDSGGVWIIIPWSAIDAVRNRLGGPARAGKREQDEQWASKMHSGLEESSLELTASLSEARISLKRAMELKVGDIIAIDSPETVTLLAGNLPLLRGSFGSHKGQMAVKLEHIFQLPGQRV